MKYLFKAKVVDRFKDKFLEAMYPDNFKLDYVYGSLVESGDGKCYICISVAGANHNTFVNNTIATMVEVIPETICKCANYNCNSL